MDNIFQIFLCKEKYREENLREHAEFFNTARQNMLAVYPDYQYNLYTNVEAARFVKAFSPEVYRAYWTLAPFAYRADLLRLCLLYEYGGWYFDITTHPLFRFDSDKDFFVKSASCKLLENFVIYAKPKSPFLKLCIDQIVENVRHTRYFEPNRMAALSVSGPALLYSLLDKSQETLVSANFGVLDRHAEVIVDNKVFAVHKNKTGIVCLESFGFKGTNTYHEMYASRLAYITPWTRFVVKDITDIEEIRYA